MGRRAPCKSPRLDEVLSASGNGAETLFTLLGGEVETEGVTTSSEFVSRLLTLCAVPHFIFKDMCLMHPLNVEYSIVVIPSISKNTHNESLRCTIINSRIKIFHNGFQRPTHILSYTTRISTCPMSNNSCA